MTKLTTRYIESIVVPGRFGDGNGLFLIVQKSGECVRKSWMIRYTSPATGQRRDMGLGSLKVLGLAKARARAIEMKGKLLLSIDPLNDLIARRERVPHRSFRLNGAPQPMSTLEDFSREFYERHRVTLRNEKYQRQWIVNLDRLILVKLGKRRMDTLTVDDFLGILQPLALSTGETCRRVVTQLAMIFRDCHARDRINHNVIEKVKVLIRYPVAVKGNHQSLAWEEVPKLVNLVLHHRTIGNATKYGFLFALLNAARTNELLGCRWSEIDLTNELWSIPPAKMKAFRAHHVYLSKQSVAILQHMKKTNNNLSTFDIVFRSPRGNKRELSNMVFLNLLKQMDFAKKTTFHGLCRASFSTFANERSVAKKDIVDACLAHVSGDRVSAAYDRSKYIGARKLLLQSWADHVLPLDLLLTALSRTDVRAQS
jgi:integrase